MPALASAWTTEAPSEPWLVVSEGAISYGDAQPIVRLEGGLARAEDKEGGASGYQITALRERLASARPASPRIGIAIDPEVPYRTVAEVVYTLGQAERTDLAFLVRRGAAVAALPITIPTLDARLAVEEAQPEVEQMLLGALGGDDGAFADVLRDGNATPEPIEPASPEEVDQLILEAGPEPEEAEDSLSLGVTLTSAGIVVSGSGGRLAPGCETVETGHVITLPLRDGAHDLAGLTRCLERVHREHSGEDAVIVSADPDVRFRDVAGAIAASRGTAERPLFPRTILAEGGR